MTTPDQSPLLPCPFCGGEAAISHYPSLTTIDCTQCKFARVYQGGPYSTPPQAEGPSEARRIWNTRPAPIVSPAAGSAGRPKRPERPISVDGIQEREAFRMHIIELESYCTTLESRLARTEALIKAVKRLYTYNHGAIGSDIDEALARLASDKEGKL